MKFLSNEQKGSLYAIISGLFYGLLGYFGIKIINADLSIVNMLFWRFVVSAASILPILLYKINIVKANPREILKALFYGIAFYSTSSITYFIGSRYIGTGLSMVLVYTYPAFVILLNWFLYNKAVPKIYYLAILIILLGLALLADVSSFAWEMLGIIFGILSSILYAFYLVFSKKNNLPPLLSTFIVSVGCAITCLIFSQIWGDGLTTPNTINVWLYILALGILCTALPILFLLEAFKYISTTKASILSVLEPVFVVIFGVILLAEEITLLQSIGIVTILSGAIITLLKPK